MNNSFSLRRTLLVARKHYAENFRHYLYGMLAFALVCYLFAWWLSDPNSKYNFLIKLYPGITAGALLGFLYYNAVVCCRNYYKSDAMIRNYTLPAAAAEHYLVVWFHTTVVATGLFLLLLGPVALLAPQCEPYAFFRSYPVLIFIFAVQAGALFTRSLARDKALRWDLLTAAVALAAYLLYAHAINIGSDASIVSETIFSSSGVLWRGSESTLAYRLPMQMSVKAGYSIVALWIPVLWIASYFKFKERTLK